MRMTLLLLALVGLRIGALFVVGVDTHCQLSSLSLSNGISLSPAFSSGVTSYTCSCANPSALSSTQVTIATADPQAGATLTFDGSFAGNLANGFPTSNSLTFGVGTNTISILVTCGFVCSQPYTITCTKPSSVTGDPQFVGLRGQQYQVHGVSGEIYNIVSDHDLQYNSRFVFLDSGECPIINGKKQKGCWSHPGSYLGELGLKTRAGDLIHIQTGPAKKGFEAVTLNGKDVQLGETILLGDNLGALSLNSTHVSTVQIGVWSFVFENSDYFVNQRVQVDDARHLRSHGLLGQTWSDKTYPNAIKYIQGEVDDYVIRDGNVFGDSFVFNKFD